MVSSRWWTKGLSSSGPRLSSVEMPPDSFPFMFAARFHWTTGGRKILNSFSRYGRGFVQTETRLAARGSDGEWRKAESRRSECRPPGKVKCKVGLRKGENQSVETCAGFYRDPTVLPSGGNSSRNADRVIRSTYCSETIDNSRLKSK